MVTTRKPKAKKTTTATTSAAGKHTLTHQVQVLQPVQDTEQTSQAKNEFLVNMSHEIRTPMNGVIGMTQLLKTTSLDDTQKEYLECLETSAKSLMYLINDILDLSKMDAGRIELEQSSFSLRGTISNIVRTKHYDLHAKRLPITIDIPQAVPDALMGDQLRAKQIILNLLGNAIQFTEHGNITISLAVLEQHDDQILLQLSVCDTGIGMTQETLNKIFAPFTQTTTSATRIFGGSGLGLAFCRRMVELMGGRLWAESQAGVGSTFHAALPFTVTRRTAVELLDHLDTPREVAWKGPPLRILLAEDNAINRKFAVTLLQKMGHQVVSTTNGKEAADAWDQGDFDLILMDIQMPVMDGVMSAAVIRSTEQKNGRHTPVIALTAHVLTEEKTMLLNSGFDGYVPKPVEIDTLVAEMHKVLTQR